MTRFYSDHYTADGLDQESPDDVFVKNPNAVDGQFLRYKRARFDSATFVQLGFLRMMRLRPSIRPVAMYISTPGGFEATMNWDIGLREEGEGNMGGAIDRQMFVNDLAVDTAVNRLECLIHSTGDLVPVLRGLRLFELANVAKAGQYLIDPQVMWHLTVKNSNTAGGAGDNVVMELYYT